MKNHNKGKLILFLLPILLSSGCASIMCGDDKTINVQSNPSGAKFKISSIHSYNKSSVEGVTPTNVTLKRGSGGFMQAGDYYIEFEKEGYKTKKVPIEQGFETGWYFGGNIVLGGFIGILIIDPLTGAMWDIKDVYIDLEPKQEISISGNGIIKTLKGYKFETDKYGKRTKIPIYE